MSQLPDPPPLQSIETADALYTRVLARGRRLRRERRAFLATAAMSFILLAAAVPVALTNDDGSQVATTDRTLPTTTVPGTTTTTEHIFPPYQEETSTTLGTVPVVQGATVTTTGRTTATTRRRTATTSAPTTAAPKPSGTQAPGTTTTTAVPSSPPATPCAPTTSLLVAHPQIAFIRGGDLHVTSADGAGTPTALTATPSEAERAPAFAPLGDRIAYQDPDGIAVIDVTGGQPQLRTMVPGDSTPAWSPDGNLIAFVRGGDIYTMPADGGAAQKVVDLVDPVGSPTFSPNSCQIAFTWRGGVLRSQRDGTGITNVRGSAAEPSWGANGRLAVAVPGSRTEVFLMNADGSGYGQLTLGGGLDPSWSGAGDAVAFEAPTRPQPGIYTQRADGSGLSRITTDAGDRDPAW